MNFTHNSTRETRTASWISRSCRIDLAILRGRQMAHPEQQTGIDSQCPLALATTSAFRRL
jgi:hypothetical protein